MLSSKGRWSAPSRPGSGAVRVIAEAAQGFEGDPTLAKLLVRGAAAAGADVVKFQLVYVDELASRDYVHYELFRQLEMPDAAWAAVIDEAKLCAIDVAFDVFGARSLDLALTLGAGAIKIHASDFFNHALVGDALRRAPHVFLSAGGVELPEIDEWLQRHGVTSSLTLLVGFQAEPTAASDNHFARLGALRARYPGLAIGFMDHADGASDDATWLAVLAVPYGVSAIEKHLTLDRSLCLEDYQSAVAPDEFATFVRRLRIAEAAVGRPDLSLTAAETTYRRKALKPVIARQALTAGGQVVDGAVTLLRAPLESGRQPIFRIERALGRRVRNDVPIGRPLYEDDLA